MTYFFINVSIYWKFEAEKKLIDQFTFTSNNCFSKSFNRLEVNASSENVGKFHENQNMILVATQFIHIDVVHQKYIHIHARIEWMGKFSKFKVIAKHFLTNHIHNPFQFDLLDFFLNRNLSKTDYSLPFAKKKKQRKKIETQ